MKRFVCVLMVLLMFFGISKIYAQSEVVMPLGYEVVKTVMTYGPASGALPQLSLATFGFFGIIDWVNAMSRIDEDGYLKSPTEHELMYPNSTAPILFDWTIFSKGYRNHPQDYGHGYNKSEAGYYYINGVNYGYYHSMKEFTRHYYGQRW